MTKEQIIAALEQLGKSVSALEKDLGMPSGTLAKAKSGVRELPEKWVTILNDLLATQKEMVVIPENVKEPVLEKKEINTHFVNTMPMINIEKQETLPIQHKEVVKSADKTFPALLLRFNKLVEDMPKVSLIRAELDKISLDAYGSAELNYNQRSAIMERCSNYIKGDYGRKITA